MISPRTRLAGVALAVVLVTASCGLRRGAGDSGRPPLDLNHASVRKLEQLPGVTPSMARRIAAGRPYEDPHQLVERGILTERELERIADRVVVQDRAR